MFTASSIPRRKETVAALGFKNRPAEVWSGGDSDVMVVS